MEGGGGLKKYIVCFYQSGSCRMLFLRHYLYPTSDGVKGGDFMLLML